MNESESADMKFHLYNMTYPGDALVGWLVRLVKTSA
jgi:hypothetical protein